MREKYKRIVIRSLILTIITGILLIVFLFSYMNYMSTFQDTVESIDIKSYEGKCIQDSYIDNQYVALFELENGDTYKEEYYNYNGNMYEVGKNYTFYTYNDKIYNMYKDAIIELAKIDIQKNSSRGKFLINEIKVNLSVTVMFGLIFIIYLIKLMTYTEKKI